MVKKKNGLRFLLMPAALAAALLLSGGMVYAGQQKTTETCEEKSNEEAVQGENSRTDTAGEEMTEEIIMPDAKTQEKDMDLLSQELEKADAQDLKESLKRLYERGCSGIEKIERVKEEKGLIYLVITDADGDQYYIDTNSRGMFGTVLSQTGNDNAQLLADSLGIEAGRQLLYAAEKMEISGCGKIVSVEDITTGQAFRFAIVNDRDEKYLIRMGKDGSLGDIRDEQGNDVYAMME